jgi:hypothetical protein
MQRLAETRPARSGIAALVAAALAAGCGAGGAELRDGVYRYELSETYLRGQGISARQARSESGAHEITLDRGAFVDRWRATDGTAGACAGVFALAGSRVTFRWTDGCAGDWAMTYSLAGDRVTWSGFEPLDPRAGPVERRLTEVFNGVPWTRTGDVPGKGEQ